jgi:hydrogenase expression/formation protein HypC
MCLAFPGKIISIKNDFAIIDFDGVRKKINTIFVNVRKNDYVIVHAGFAIQKLSKKSALEVFEICEKNRKNNQKNK